MVGDNGIPLAGLPAGFDPAFLLLIGVACITLVVTVFAAGWVARLTGDGRIAIGLGVVLAPGLYIAVTRFGLALLAVAPLAILVCAAAVAGATALAHLELSRADIS